MPKSNGLPWYETLISHYPISIVNFIKSKTKLRNRKIEIKIRKSGKLMCKKFREDDVMEIESSNAEIRWRDSYIKAAISIVFSKKIERK